MTSCKWPLGDGTSLEFIIYDPDTQWNNVAGLYIFAYDDSILWRAVYVGKTTDFKARPGYHPLWETARQNGATHIHALSVPLEANRDRWEKMLIHHLQPPLNVQHRPKQPPPSRPSSRYFPF